MSGFQEAAIGNIADVGDVTRFQNIEHIALPRLNALLFISVVGHASTFQTTPEFPVFAMRLKPSLTHHPHSVS